MGRVVGGLVRVAVLPFKMAVFPLYAPRAMSRLFVSAPARAVVALARSRPPSDPPSVVRAEAPPATTPQQSRIRWGRVASVAWLAGCVAAFASIAVVDAAVPLRRDAAFELATWVFIGTGIAVAGGLVFGGFVTEPSDSDETPRWVSALQRFLTQPTLRTPPPASGRPATWHPELPRPAPRAIQTPRDAELVAAEWMIWMGFTDARATQFVRDGGIDVESVAAVAQVKATFAAVGRPEVQQIVGAAAPSGRRVLFFAWNGYTPDAAAWGTSAGVALFRFDMQGVPAPVNEAAQSLMQPTPKQAPPEEPSHVGPSPTDRLAELSRATMDARRKAR